MKTSPGAPAGTAPETAEKPAPKATVKPARKTAGPAPKKKAQAGERSTFWFRIPMLRSIDPRSTGRSVRILQIRNRGTEEGAEARRRPPWREVLVWYLRLIGLHLLGAGIIHWARIVGFSEWRGHWFWEMPVAEQTVTVYFGVLDLVSAIGLWLGVSWGVVIWIFRILTQTVMHTAFSDIFGRRPYEIGFFVLTVGIYFVLAYLAQKEQQSAERNPR